MRMLFKVLVIFAFCWFLSVSFSLAAKPYQVLVVFSYEEDFPWDIEVREGIESSFGGVANLTFFYMNTKINKAGGELMAAEAFALYQKLQPDGVIVVDDNAQSMFVVPYLKDKVPTPVMFCGVNAEPDAYGYPAGNISGILERQPVSEAISLLLQLSPDVKRLGFMMKEGTTAQAIVQELKIDNEKYPAEFVDYLLPKTMAEALQMAASLGQTTDALYIVNFSGLPDDTGKLLNDAQIIPQLAQAYGKVVFSGSSYNVGFDGVLAAVAKTGQEQGRVASEMLLQAIQGTPVSALPVTRNYRGKRIINVTTMQKLGIVPAPIVLRGVELVRASQ